MSLEMNNDMFNGMEIDTIGEILNISMGSAATAISTLLDRKVSITTPHVVVASTREIELTELEPAIGVEINYIEGLSGANIMVLKQRDVHAIVRQMTGGMVDNPDDAELDELSISAICEVMNQMMGSSATALSDFLGRNINISTPMPVDLNGENALRDRIRGDEQAILVNFQLNIEGLIDSKFVSIMSVSLARELVDSVLGGAMVDEPVSTPEPVVEPIVDSTPQVVITQPVAPTQPPVNTTMVSNRETSRVVQQPKEVHPVKLQSFDEGRAFHGGVEQPENLDLILGVPLSVTVEIGKTTKRVKEILEFSQGTIIELDKQAGAPVDVLVNGQLIAKGDVVVIGDNFGVRINEIMKNAQLFN